MISVTQNLELFKIYTYLNQCIFDSKLIDNIYLQLSYSLQSEGMFLHDKCDSPDTHEKYHEIIIDENLLNEPNNYWITVLVHQMIHLWQFQYGSNLPPRHYHNKEYISKADEIGIVINCGESNKQELKANSLIMSAIAELPKNKLVIPRNVASQISKEGKSGKRFKFVCPECNSNCYAKYESLFLCGKCYDDNKKIIRMMCQD